MISASPHGGKEEAPPHTLSQLLFQLRCRGKKEEAPPHGLSDSMISASPHGEKKEAAARFLVGGSDGSSRISFGWNRKLASKMLKQCDSAAKAVICFAYRCSASSHALAAAISASLRGGKRKRRLTDSMISASPHGGKRKRLHTRLSTGMISASPHGEKEAAAYGRSDSMISAMLYEKRGNRLHFSFKNI
jgi:hypothetical protein